LEPIDSSLLSSPVFIFLKKLAVNDFTEMLNGCWLWLQENAVKKGKKEMPQVIFSLACSFVSSFRKQ
jgi:hypothetical protein